MQSKELPIFFYKLMDFLSQEINKKYNIKCLMEKICIRKAAWAVFKVKA